jgi:hypothetical protein
MDHADPARESVGGACEPYGFSVEDDRSLVRPVDALQDAHERRLSSTVAADDRMDHPRRDREVDPVIGDDGTEPTRQSPRADPGLCGVRRRHGRIPRGAT